MGYFIGFLFRCALPFLLYFSVESAAVMAADVCFPECWEMADFPLLLTCIVDFLMIPILFGLYRADGSARRRPADRSFQTGVVKYLLSIAGFLGLYIAVNIFVTSTGIAWDDEGFQEASEVIDSASLGLQFLTAGIVGPLLEEFLFRGLLLRRLEETVKPLWAMLLSALMFGVFHENLTQGLAAFLLGIFLGIAYLGTDSLLVPVMMHAAANCLAILLGMPEADTFLDPDLMYLAVPCFSALAAGVFLWTYAGTLRKLSDDVLHAKAVRTGPQERSDQIMEIPSGEAEAADDKKGDQI